MVRSSLGLFLIAAAAQAVPEGFVIREFLGNAQVPEIYPTAVAAAANGDVYYAVREFDGYGKLSGKTLDSLRAGERVEVDPRLNPVGGGVEKGVKIGPLARLDKAKVARGLGQLSVERR